MAERTEGSIEIEADPPEVMDVIRDFPSYPDWAGVESAEVLEEDDEGWGSAVAFEVSQMGFSARYTLVYAYKDDDQGVSWTTREAEGAVRDVEGEYVLEPEGVGTRVTYRLAVELGVRVPGLVKRQGERQVVKTALEGLKRRVEEG